MTMSEGGVADGGFAGVMVAVVIVDGGGGSEAVSAVVVVVVVVGPAVGIEVESTTLLPELIRLGGGVVVKREG